VIKAAEYIKCVLFAIASIPVVASAQVKIDGVGFFKIGKSKSAILDSLKHYLGEPIEFVNTDFVKGHVYKAIEGNNTGNDSDTNLWYYCPEYESYLIPLFTISGIDFENIDIIFHFDTLVSFRSHFRKEIEDAVNAKYGRAKRNYDKVVPQNYKVTWRCDEIECGCSYYYGNVLDNGFNGAFYIEKKQTFQKVEKCMKKHLIEKIKQRDALKRSILKSNLDKF
jgi:hypothetical protein